MSRGVQAIRARKERRPDLYCPKCLWMTGGGACPRHGGPAWTPEREREAGARSRESVKVCGCGAVHGAPEWAALPLCGRQDDGYDVLEMRNCPCGSTLAIVVGHSASRAAAPGVEGGA